MWTIIGAIVVGAIIGALARLVMPGSQKIGIIMTIVLGVVGSFVRLVESLQPLRLLRTPTAVRR